MNQLSLFDLIDSLSNVKYGYSLLRQSTGSFFEAILAGIKPAIKVNKQERTKSINAPPQGKTATLAIPAK